MLQPNRSIKILKLCPTVIQLANSINKMNHQSAFTNGFHVKSWEKMLALTIWDDSADENTCNKGLRFNREGIKCFENVKITILLMMNILKHLKKTIMYDPFITIMYRENKEKSICILLCW